MSKSPIVVLLVMLVGCGKDPAAPSKSANDVAPRAVTTSTAPRAVSPNVGVGEDIIKACNIQFSNPSEAPKFDFDSEDLGQADIQILDQVAKCLTTGPLKGRNLELVGRADPRGPEQYNMVLGAKRAHQVTDYLEKQGVPPLKVRETSRGALDATGESEQGWRNDRRVDLVLGS
jgi:peptidoglycan-associated lipoprotein